MFIFYWPMVAVLAAALVAGCQGNGSRVSLARTSNQAEEANLAAERDETNAASHGRYATVNGLKMYYEVHGTGRPLLLLHGAFGLATVYPVLAKNRQVIAVELQGHGHTADIDRPLTIEQMADDTAQ